MDFSQVSLPGSPFLLYKSSLQKNTKNTARYRSRGNANTKNKSTNQVCPNGHGEIRA